MTRAEIATTNEITIRLTGWVARAVLRVADSDDVDPDAWAAEAVKDRYLRESKDAIRELMKDPGVREELAVIAEHRAESARQRAIRLRGDWQEDSGATG